MNATPMLSADTLTIDAPKEAQRIEKAIRGIVFEQLRRSGVVVGLSGGIDSSVTAALCVRALGNGRVLGLLMPEAESSSDSVDLARQVAKLLDIKVVLEDITPILRAVGCYQRRDEAIRLVMPEYGDGYKCKLSLSSPVVRDGYRIFSIVVRSPEGKETTVRLNSEAFQGIVSATSFKQRVRKMMEYYYADRLHYAVAGTPNRLEYDQGFFVKNGDGSADLKPIAHLYKTQVYQLAEYLEIPEEIRRRPPTTDTYSLEQSQEEFYFSLPYDKMDLCLYGRSHGIQAADLSSVVGLTTEQVDLVYKDIDSKRTGTRSLHLSAFLVEDVPLV